MGAGKCKCDDCVEMRDRRQEIRQGGVTEEELPWRRPGGRRSKKNKWCRGKEGREHKFEWVDKVYYFLGVCSACGKHDWNMFRSKKWGF